MIYQITQIISDALTASELKNQVFDRDDISFVKISFSASNYNFDMHVISTF